MYRLDLELGGGVFYKIEVVWCSVMGRASLVSVIGLESVMGGSLWMSPGRGCRLVLWRLFWGW